MHDDFHREDVLTSQLLVISKFSHTEREYQGDYLSAFGIIPFHLKIVMMRGSKARQADPLFTAVLFYSHCSHASWTLLTIQVVPLRRFHYDHSEDERHQRNCEPPRGEPCSTGCR